MNCENEFSVNDAENYVKMVFESVIDDDYPDTEDSCILYLMNMGFTEEQSEELVLQYS